MKRLKFTLFILLFFISVFYYSCKQEDVPVNNNDPVNDPTQIFSQTYGSNLSDLVTGVAQSDDGGVVVCGYTIAGAFGDNDFFVMKLDDSGHVAWSNLYGSSGNDQASSLQKTADGGYIICGSTNSYSGTFDPFTLKIDNTGNVQWSARYFWWNEDYANSVSQTSDGGYILTGFSNSFGAGGYDTYALKLDQNGGIMWARFYGGAQNDIGNSVLETGDNGFIIGGNTLSFGNLGEGYIIKTFGDGGFNWSKTYGGTGFDNIRDIRKSSNGYIACGSTVSFGLITADAYVFNIDNSGFVYWSRTFGSNGSGESLFNTVRQTSDGGFVLGGSMHSSMISSGDMCLVKLFGNGEFNYAKIFGGVNDDIASALTVKSDGGYLLAGTTASFGAGSNDVYLQSLKSDGTGCMTDNPFTPSGGSPQTEVNNAATIYTDSVPYETINTQWGSAAFSVVTNTQCIISPSGK